MAIVNECKKLVKIECVVPEICLWTNKHTDMIITILLCPTRGEIDTVWRGYLSAARCRLAYGPADAIATHCLLLQ